MQYAKLVSSTPRCLAYLVWGRITRYTVIYRWGQDVCNPAQPNCSQPSHSGCCFLYCCSR